MRKSWEEKSAKSGPKFYAGFLTDAVDEHALRRAKALYGTLFNSQVFMLIYSMFPCLCCVFHRAMCRSSRVRKGKSGRQLGGKTMLGKSLGTVVQKTGRRGSNVTNASSLGT